MLRPATHLLLLWLGLRSLAMAAGSELSASERLKACDPQIAVAAAEEILQSPDSLRDPGQIFPAASVLFGQGRRDEAVFWHWVAQLRSRYRYPIPKIDELLTRMPGPPGLPINTYALQHTRKFDLMLLRVLEWDRETPNPLGDKLSAADFATRRDEIYRSFDNLRAQITAQRDELERQARAAWPQAEKMHASTRARQCREELVDSAEAARRINVEESLVAEFVKSQEDVISAVGPVERALVAAYVLQDEQLLPSQYDVAVKGNRVAFAIVEVSRSAGKAEFRLACVTYTSLGNREAFKHPCHQ